MTTNDKQSEEEAFLASKQAMWTNFVWLCGGGLLVVVVILVAMAAFLL